MLPRFSPAPGALVLMLAACAQSANPPTATEFRVPLVINAEAAPPLNALNFVAHTSGDEEVPARPSKGQGEAVFKLSDDGTTIEYHLNVANIENVVQSHIHIAPVGVNGPIVVFLFGPVAAGGGRVNGVLATGSFTSANFIGPLAGRPMSELIAAIQAGNAYVNVHTNDGVDGINTGPGDFPGGEIRGQIDGGHAH